VLITLATIYTIVMLAVVLSSMRCKRTYELICPRI
jgi:hypothetical protein